MSSALLNIVIGLVTSILSGSAVLLWRRAASSRVLHRKADSSDSARAARVLSS
jgi:hypothetical protein